MHKALIAFAKDKMTPFKAPSKVHFVDGLPKSLVGKVLKKELRKLLYPLNPMGPSLCPLHHALSEYYCLKRFIKRFSRIPA